jgi:hypothetical protein
MLPRAQQHSLREIEAEKEPRPATRAISPQSADPGEAPPLSDHVHVQVRHGSVPPPMVFLRPLTCMSVTPSRPRDLAPSALPHLKGAVCDASQDLRSSIRSEVYGRDSKATTHVQRTVDKDMMRLAM